MRLLFIRVLFVFIFLMFFLYNYELYFISNFVKQFVIINNRLNYSNIVGLLSGGINLCNNYAVTKNIKNNMQRPQAHP